MSSYKLLNPREILWLFFAIQQCKLNNGVVTNYREWPRFKCLLPDSPVGHSADDGSALLLQPGKDLAFACALYRADGESTKQTKRLTGWPISAGETPVLTLTNSTWTRKFRLKNCSDGVWSYTVRRSLLLGTPARGSSVAAAETAPREEWIYAIATDTGLYSGRGSVVDVQSHFLLTQALGAPLPKPPQLLSGPQVDGFRLVVSRSPCAPSVAVVAMIAAAVPLDGSQRPPAPAAYAGITHAAFASGSTVWYDLATSLIPACDTTGRTISKAACNDLLLLDIKLTNSNLFVKTLLAFYVTTPANLSKASNLTWNRINPFRGTWGENITDLRSAKVSYSSACLDAQRRCVLKDYISVFYKEHRRSIMCMSETPFLRWSCRDGPKAHDTVHISHNIHTNVTVALLRLESAYAVEVTDPSFNIVHFPAFTIPSEANLTRIMHHPQSMKILAIGDQIWQSNDGGATFTLIYSQVLAESTIEEIIFDQNSLGGRLAALITINRTHNGYAIGNVAAGRLKFIDFLASAATMFFDHIREGHMFVIFPLSDSGELVRHEVLNVNERLHKPTEVQTELLMEIPDVGAAVFYERLPSGQTAGRMQQYFVGMVLKQKLSGHGVITQITRPTRGSFISKLHVNVKTAFEPDKQHAGGLAYVTVAAATVDGQFILSIGSRAEATPTWNSTILGKTVALLDLRASFIIVSRLNSTSVIGESASFAWQAEISFHASRYWLVYDFSSRGRWWLQEGDCTQMALVASSPAATVHALDLGSAVVFTATSASWPEQRLAATYSNPLIFNFGVRRQQADGRETLRVTLADARFSAAASSVAFEFRTSSLTCTRVSYYFLVLLCCPVSKHIAFKYPEDTTPSAAGRPSSAMYTLPVNYRPPSVGGWAIPITQNIYHADPGKSKYNSKYAVSRSTGTYKQCAGKPNRTACGCPEEKLLSNFVADSDCIEKVHRLSLPGEFYLCVISTPPDSNGKREHVTELVLNYQAVSISELNGRTDYIITGAIDESYAVAPDLNHSESLYVPPDVQITLNASGLFHFSVAVPEHFSYCQLYTEFLFYVDQPPVLYPLIYLADFAVVVAVGSMILIAYCCNHGCSCAGDNDTDRLSTPLLALRMSATCQPLHVSFFALPEAATPSGSEKSTLINANAASLTNPDSQPSAPAK